MTTTFTWRHYAMACALFLVTPSVSVQAAATPVSTNDSPIEISAQTALEWDRNARTYTALGDARATRDGATLRADTLTAHYAEDAGATNLTTLDATGAVVLSSAPYKAYGDKASYDVTSGQAILTGGHLRIETETDTLTARDKITYNSTSGVMTAWGAVTAVRGEQKLTADRIDVHFAQDAQGGMKTDRMTAQGQVVITTPTETAHGDAAVYDVATQTATLTGQVRLYQGQSYLEGTRATVDMRTGVSALYAGDNIQGETGSGRVRGVFYPKKDTPATNPTPRTGP